MECVDGMTLSDKLLA
jgi:serine/threonine protein kinase